MASQYDPALCERLVAKHKATSPAVKSGWTQQLYDDMADQLEAAKLRISSADAELDAANADLSTLRWLRASAQAEVDRLSGCSKSWANHAASIIAERDALRAELEVARITIQMADTLAGQQLEVIAKLRAEVERMRPVVDAAEYYVDAGGAAEVSDAACDLQVAVSDYRAKERS